MANFEDFGLLVGRYHATPTTLADSQPSEILLDENGRIIISGRYLEDSAHTSGDAGLFMMAVRSDNDTVMTSADGDYSPITVDQYGRLRIVADFDVDFDYVYAEDTAHTSGDLGTYMLSVRADTRPVGANVSADGDYASLFVNASGELWVHDEDVLGKLTSIETSVQLLDDVVYAEDAAHVSGDKGAFILGIRNDTDAALTSADGDYSGIAVDSAGRIKTVNALSGSEEFATADAFTADEDGLIAVSGTSYVDIASLAVGAGETAYIYGWQFDCDQNATGRLVVDDGTEVVVYKVRLNSSAMPGMSEHWSEGGRIEIAGGATINVKVQVRKRSSGAVTAQASGSIHARIG